jgi:archaellum component FlaG (FlaF/FlaG flagellin family)
MGFDTVSSHLIIFIAVVTVTGAIAMRFRGYISSAETSINYQRQMLQNKIETDITIEVIRFTDATNKTNVYIKNTGKTKLDLRTIDMYIDSIWVPRSLKNRTIELLSDTDTINPGVWDPSEAILITTNLTVSRSTDHTVVVATDSGFKDTETFSI